MKKIFNFLDFINEGKKSDRETISLEDFLNDAKKFGLLRKTKNIKDESIIVSFFYDVSMKPIDVSFPYEFIEEFEQKGDGQGYETFYVFKRKSDSKTFSYYIYDGRIEENELSECWRKKKSGKWNFECKY